MNLKNLRNLVSRPITSVALTLLVCLGISGCQPILPLKCEINPLPKPEEKQTDKIVASLYVDATESMRGFVAIGSTTRYARIIEAIEGAVLTGWNAEFERYQFGTKVSGKMPKSSFKATQASFYKSGKTPGFEYNEIDKAVSHSTPGKDRLTIIITDLYQRDADINAILDPLSQNYLKAGYAVGIVAIKSEFIGTIYDVGAERQQFDYTTGNKPEKYHPFYLIVLGTQANVEHFFELLKQDAKAKQAKIDSPENAKFLIFNSQLVRKISILNLANSQIVKPSQGRSLERIPGGLRIGNNTIRIDENYKQSVERLKISNLTSEESGVEYKVDYTPFPYLPKVSQVNVDLKSSKFNSNNKKFVPDNQSSSQALTLSNWKIEKEQIEFLSNINKSILKPGIYQFNVSVIAQSLVDEPWWEEWNGTESIVVDKDGAKTYNLFPFLQRLKNTTFQIADRRLGQFCYAVQRE